MDRKTSGSSGPTSSFAFPFAERRGKSTADISPFSVVRTRIFEMASSARRRLCLMAQAPRTMRFTKMHGLGNDFVVFNGRFIADEDPRRFVEKLCDRNRGVGGDGVVVVSPSKTGDSGVESFKMEYYNRDGSRAICGNAMRCAAKFIAELGVLPSEADRGETGVREFDLVIDSGVVRVALLEREGLIRTPLGTITFLGEEIPTAERGEHVDREFFVCGERLLGTAVGIGNPHLVFFVESVERFDVAGIGAALEVDPFFPKRTNVEFIEVLNRNEVRMRVWERGVGETLACGTGAAASVAAGVKKGLLDSPVTVHLLGGELVIDYEKSSQKIALTGPAKRVFDGEVVLSEL